MHDQQETPQFERFVTITAAHLAEDGGYGSVPDAASLQLPTYRTALFGRSRTVGMAVNIDMVALCPADGLSPADLEVRLDAVATLVQRIGEQGNIEAQRGGKGRQVAALLLWVLTEAAPFGNATSAAAMQRELRGSSFGRWPVDCAAVLLDEGQVALPPGIQGRRRTRLAGELLQAWQAPPTAPAVDQPQQIAAHLDGDRAHLPYKPPALDQPQHVAAQQRRRDLAGLLSGGPAPATYALLVLIGLFFATMQLSGSSTSARVLIKFGALVTPLVLAGQWWRLVSAAFLHIGWAHIAFNGFALYIYGPLVERLYGPTRFLTIYLLAAIAGDLLSLPFVNGISAGASGAIFGLFGATIALVLQHRRRLPAMIREPLWRNAVAVVVLNAVLTVAVAGINLYAHAGGFLAGLLLGALLQPRPLVTGRTQGVFGAAVGMAVAAVCLAALLLTLRNLSL